jgi:hypothetical protein
MIENELSSTSTTNQKQSKKDGTSQTQTRSTINPGGEIELHSFVEVKSPYGNDAWFDQYFVMQVEPDHFVVCQHYISDNMGQKYSQLGVPARYPKDRIKLSAEKPPRFLSSFASDDYLRIYGANHLQASTIVGC